MRRRSTGVGIWTILERVIGETPDATPRRAITVRAIEAACANDGDWERGKLPANWADVLLDPRLIPDDFRWHLRFDGKGTIYVSPRYHTGQTVQPSAPLVECRGGGFTEIVHPARMIVVKQLADGWIEVKAAPGSAYPPHGLIGELAPQDVDVV